MPLALDVEEALQEAHYSCYRQRDPANMIVFEDENFLGAAFIFDSAEMLLGEWKAAQQSSLNSHANQLRRAGEKAWNCYLVLLCSEDASEEISARFSAIEEDFVATRKLARAGLKTTAEVRRALLPLLPLQATVTIRETSGPDLRTRLTDLPAQVVEELLETGRASDIAGRLLEEE